MKKEIKFEDIKGKTVVDYSFSITSGQCVITFSDNTFTTIGILIDPYDGSNEIIPEPIQLFNFGDYMLIKLGIITEDELKIKKQEKEAAFKIERNNKNRELLKRLKAEYDN